MNKRFANAFTLIELLVVIAIIGILSGLIIVGMSNSVQSAKIARAQVFSASLRDSLLANLVAEFKFDEGAGTSVSDSWAGSYTGTLTDTTGCDATHCPQWQTANCVYGKCLSFNGTGAYITYGDVLKPDQVKNRTMEVWINPSAQNGNTIFATGNLSIFKGGHSRFTITNPTTITVSYDYDLSPYQANISCSTDLNKWNYLVFTMDVSDPVNSTIKIYKNGDYINQTVQQRFIGGQSSPAFTIGAETNGWPTAGMIRFFSGLMDNIRIYNSLISTSQISANYYAGLSRLLGGGNMEKQEYDEKLFQLTDKYAKR